MERQEQITITMEALRLHDANDTCMTVKECAKWLKCHPLTVKRKISKGEIKSTLIGNEHRIPKLQFLDNIVNS